MRKSILWFSWSVIFALVIFWAVPGVFAAGKVVVYSTNQQAQNDMMATAFEQATGIKCEMVRAGSGVTIKRIRAERGRPLGDVALGMSKIILLNNMDLWEPYKIKDLDIYPEEFKDPNGMWIGQMVHVMAFVYNTKLLSADQAPKGWSDFLDPKWQDRVAYCNPNNSGSAYTQLSIMLQLWGDDENGWKKVEKVLKHAKITQQSSLVYKGVAEGEFPSGITMEYAGYRYKKGGAPVEVVYPEDGTVAYTEGAAIIKGAKNRENARKFLDWASSLDARKKIVSQFMRRPARPDIDFTELVPGMLPLAKIKKVQGYDRAYWTKRRPEILKKVKDALLRIK
ncbi:MAG: extracellular solute-binding protein [Deltaproteobacteria bacterium]|nr:extracellular solute-binding protein [Deltaproteobacteria bacterium]MBW2305831.1 extracellular solute-binding protein [Deltaproteobacteria bacterium]